MIYKTLSIRSIVFIKSILSIHVVVVVVVSVACASFIIPAFQFNKKDDIPNITNTPSILFVNLDLNNHFILFSIFALSL
jgi:hypothetical protein